MRQIQPQFKQSVYLVPLGEQGQQVGAGLAAAVAPGIKSADTALGNISLQRSKM